MTVSNNDEEIDLGKIIRKIFKEKHIIFLCVFSCFVLSLTYIQFRNVKYKTTATLTPPLERDLESIDYFSLTKYSREELLSKIFFIAKNETYRKDFYTLYKTELNGISSNSDNLYKTFNESLHIFQQEKIFAKENSNLFKQVVNLEFEYPDKINGPFILSEYINNIEKHVRLSILEEFIRLKGLKEEQLQREKTLLLFKLEGKRKNEIAKLEEAFSLAQALNLHIFSDTFSNLEENSKNSFVLDLTKELKPPYLLGTKALTVQLNNLRNRQDLTIVDDEGINIETELLKLSQIDQEYDSATGNYPEYIGKQFSHINFLEVLTSPSVPTEHLDKKKGVILSVSLLIGLMLGLFLIFMKFVLLQPDKKDNSNDLSKEGKPIYTGS
ncbi:MAG: hypothetical protein CMP11_02630 [Zetaproteobacteria bacterium]|nr:hypothetical protein [Pseudobdellovibrionaceae bacterium]|tara:strand:+ start:1052 stop:2200 length:1149 start_codon:yes stop_codon:yes gene_type:complete